MQLTPNLNLKKPGATDNVNIDDLNDNTDILDAEVTKLASTTEAGRMSAADKMKLNGIAAGAQVNTVTSVAGKTGAVTLAKADVGLSNVENVQQAPISHVGAGGSAHAAASTSAAGFMSAADKSKLDGIAAGAQVNRAIATQAQAQAGTDNTTDMTPLRVAQAISALAPASPVQSVAGKTGAVTLVKGDVGLGNVDNVQQAPITHVGAGGSAHAIATTSMAGFMSAEDKQLSANRDGYGTTAGSATAYTLTLTPAPTLVAGLRVTVKLHTASGANPTLNVNGLGARPIRKPNGTAPTAGLLKLDSVYTLVYDGVNFILQGEGGEYGTATAADVLTGKTIGTDSGLVTGTMPNRTGNVTGQSVSRNGTTLRIRPQPGYYPGDAGNSVQMTDANFVAENIPEGISMFGLAGSLRVPKVLTVLDQTNYNADYSMHADIDTTFVVDYAIIYFNFPPWGQNQVGNLIDNMMFVYTRDADFLSGQTAATATAWPFQGVYRPYNTPSYTVGQFTVRRNNGAKFTVTFNGGRIGIGYKAILFGNII